MGVNLGAKVMRTLAWITVVPAGRVAVARKVAMAAAEPELRVRQTAESGAAEVEGQGALRELLQDADSLGVVGHLVVPEVVEVVEH